jgi:NADH-quinone oxidoreductase subunit G
MPKVKINDDEVEVPPGTNMIEAAARVGVEIPHYCYHPHLSIAGNCRMCMVEVHGPRGTNLEIACNMKASEGLAIRTDSEKVKAVRSSVMEFLLVNHPLDCPICDQSGECRLQDYYMEHGRYDSRGVEPKVSKHKRQDIGEHIVLDAERCVQCSRCERFGDEVTHTGELRLMNRGDHTEIGMFPGDRLRHDYQGCLADICPVGALTSKDFRFERRVWYLTETEGLCTGCATGCNIKVCHQQGEVFRYLPRRNDAVNKSWMCDHGRGRHTDVGGLHRLLRASGEGLAAQAAGSDPLAGAAELARRIRAARSVGFVLGQGASNEANWALVQLAKAHRADARFFVVPGADAGAIGVSDAILIDADKNPNSAGVALIADWLRAGGTAVGGAAELEDGALDLVVVLEDDIVSRLPGATLPPVAYLGWRRCPTAERAILVLPVAHAVEMDATYVNRDGRVQRTRRAVGPAGDAVPAYALLERVAVAAGRSIGCSMPVATFVALARAIPRMAGLDYRGVGSQGRSIAPLAAPAPSASAPSASTSSPAAPEAK